MSRISTPPTIEAAPIASQPLLAAVKRQLGVAPNLFRLVANKPFVEYFMKAGRGPKGSISTAPAASHMFKTECRADGK